MTDQAQTIIESKHLNTHTNNNSTNNHQVSIFDLATDEWLAKDNEDNKLIEQNIKLVYKVVKDLNIYFDIDEFISVGMLALVNAVKTFKSAKQTKLSHYIYVCVKRAVIAYLNQEKAIRSSKIYIKDCVTDEHQEDFLIDLTDQKQNVEKLTCDREQMKIILDCLKDRSIFTQKDELFFCKFHGIGGYIESSTEELCNEFNLKLDSAYHKERYILRKLQKLCQKNLNFSSRKSNFSL